MEISLKCDIRLIKLLEPFNSIVFITKTMNCQIKLSVEKSLIKSDLIMRMKVEAKLF